MNTARYCQVLPGTAILLGRASQTNILIYIYTYIFNTIEILIPHKSINKKITDMGKPQNYFDKSQEYFYNIFNFISPFLDQ